MRGILRAWQLHTENKRARGAAEATLVQQFHRRQQVRRKSQVMESWQWQALEARVDREDEEVGCPARIQRVSKDGKEGTVVASGAK